MASEVERVKTILAEMSTGPRVVSLSEVAPERVSWLWPGRLPLGKLVILDGDPGVGKSTLTLDFAARVSTGTPWPDGADCPAGDVLILSAEDGLADTIRPRLDAAGADASRVHALTEFVTMDEDGNEFTRPPVLPGDLVEIETIVVERGVTLIVVDVLMAYLSGEVNSHRDQDVRRALHRLASLADRTGCSVLVLRHLSKGGGSNAVYRGGGSIGIVGAARAALLAAFDPEDEDGKRRVLAVTKSNLAAMAPALAYETVPDELHGCARVQWLGQSEHRAGDLLVLPSPGEDHTERDEAKEWLIGYLEDRGGQAKAADVIRDAMRDGIAKTTLTRARTRAGVTTDKGGFKSGWLWQLEAKGSPEGPLREPRRIHEETEEFKAEALDSSVPSVDSSGVRPLRPKRPCAACGQPMTVIEPNQTTHPACDLE